MVGQGDHEASLQLDRRTIISNGVSNHCVTTVIPVSKIRTSNNDGETSQNSVPPSLLAIDTLT